MDGKVANTIYLGGTIVERFIKYLRKAKACTAPELPSVIEKVLSTVLLSNCLGWFYLLIIIGGDGFACIVF